MKKFVTHTISLSPEDLTNLIKEKFDLPKDAKVHFRVSGHEDPNDTFAEQPLSYELDDAIVSYSTEE